MFLPWCGWESKSEQTHVYIYIYVYTYIYVHLQASGTRICGRNAPRFGMIFRNSKQMNVQHRISAWKLHEFISMLVHLPDIFQQYEFISHACAFDTYLNMDFFAFCVVWVGWAAERLSFGKICQQKSWSPSTYFLGGTNHHYIIDLCLWNVWQVIGKVHNMFSLNKLSQNNPQIVVIVKTWYPSVTLCLVSLWFLHTSILAESSSMKRNISILYPLILYTTWKKEPLHYGSADVICLFWWRHAIFRFHVQDEHLRTHTIKNTYFLNLYSDHTKLKKLFLLKYHWDLMTYITTLTLETYIYINSIDMEILGTCFFLILNQRLDSRQKPIGTSVCWRVHRSTGSWRSGRRLGLSIRCFLDCELEVY